MAPNKIIFQIGVLAFCVTAVFFGVQNLPLIETVSRSFIVFVGVVLTVAFALVAGSVLTSKSIAEPNQGAEAERKAKPKEAAKRPEQAAPAR
ncbi:MAG TPA: hypothetical protein DGH68_06175 [Bacteroidetes bacterium]|jgi:hypothetical protein|nr:hypothetical protein [Bacteroidota bacterium]